MRLRAVFTFHVAEDDSGIVRRTFVALIAAYHAIREIDPASTLRVEGEKETEDA